MANVRGLDLFGKHFSDFRDKYVLIGGVASALAMDDAGESFRATKDLDIVLVIEKFTIQVSSAIFGNSSRRASTRSNK